MGFKKSEVPDEITIRLRFIHQIKETGQENVYDVAHIFKPPTVEVREEYQRKLVRVKGRKVSSGVADAIRYLWWNTIIRVEGYDDLPTTGDWRTYFDDFVGRVHVEEAVERFVTYFTAEELDFSKK